jgi:hypothetical protein
MLGYEMPCNYVTYICREKNYVLRKFYVRKNNYAR